MLSHRHYEWGRCGAISRPSSSRLSEGANVDGSSPRVAPPLYRDRAVIATRCRYTTRFCASSKSVEDYLIALDHVGRRAERGLRGDWTRHRVRQLSVRGKPASAIFEVLVIATANQSRAAMPWHSTLCSNDGCMGSFFTFWLPTSIVHASGAVLPAAISKRPLGFGREVLIAEPFSTMRDRG